MVFKPTTLRVYLLRAREAGFSPSDILAGSGVDWDDIESNRTFDLHTIADLFGYLAGRTPPGFAMECGYACKIRDFGMIGFAMMSMPTLRDAFEYWNRYCLLSGHPLITTISEEADQWRMNFVPRHVMSADALRFCLEVSIAALEPVIRELTELPATTLRVDFSFPRPAVADQYRLFRTPNIQFGKQPSAYYGERSDLDRPIRSCDREVSDIFRRQCDKYLAALTNERSLREQLEDLMLTSAGALPTLDQMAAALCLSRRSLQRELSARKLSYQQIVKEFRMRQAEVLLSESRSNIKTIAYLLGFKDAGSFRRAFQAWTGQSAGQWQAAHIARPGPRRTVMHAGLEHAA